MPEAPLYLLMKGEEQTESWVHSEMVRQHGTAIKLYTNVPSVHRLMKLAFDIVELNLILNIEAMTLIHTQKTLKF